MIDSVWKIYLKLW